MSHPRMSVPGGTYLVTRSTVMSLFLLAPGPVVNQIMEYCIAWAAAGRGILIHAVSVQSNHYHLVVTDLEGKLSEFVQELNRSAARCLLAYYRLPATGPRLSFGAASRMVGERPLEHRTPGSRGRSWT